MQPIAVVSKRIFNVPYEVCRAIVKNGKFTQASVYFCMKYNCDGQIKLNSHGIRLISGELELDAKTVRRAITWLKNEGWIIKVYDEVYQVLALQKLYFQIRIGLSKTGIIWDAPIFTDTKAFIISACARKIYQFQRVKKRVAYKGIAAQPFLPNWMKKISTIADVSKGDLSLNYLSKSFFASLLDIPLTTAYDYLKYAVQRGQLIKQKNWLPSLIKRSAVELAHEHSDYPLIQRLRPRADIAVVMIPNSYLCDLTLRKKLSLKRLEKKFDLGQSPT